MVRRSWRKSCKRVGKWWSCCRLDLLRSVKDKNKNLFTRSCCHLDLLRSVKNKTKSLFTRSCCHLDLLRSVKNRNKNLFTRSCCRLDLFRSVKDKNKSLFTRRPSNFSAIDEVRYIKFECEILFVTNKFPTYSQVINQT